MSITTIANDTSRRALTPIRPRSVQRNGVGTVLSIAAAVFFGLGANVSKVALQAGLDPIRLTALRCTGTAIGLLVVILVVKPARLRIRRADLPVLIVLGLTGAAVVQFLFFTAIDRLPVGIALLLEFTAPFLISAYSLVILRHPADRRSWIAIAIGMGGLALVAKVWTDTGLDPIGVAAGLGAAACLAAFFMIGKNALQRHHPLTMSFWMFAVASVFWAVAAPWWDFDIATLGTKASLLGLFAGEHLPVWTSVVWVVLLGTLVPYLLEIASLEHLTPTAKGVVGMSEPLIAAAIAWVWLGQALDNIQLAGAGVTLLGIYIIQSRKTTPTLIS
jgi:drug/metabolite transporter (DMT)-like permease